MVTFTRRLANQLRSVFRRAFGSRGPGPAECFTVAAGTLSVRANADVVAVQYRRLAAPPAETLWLPFQLLDDCEGRSDEMVQVGAAQDGRITAQWRDRGVPQLIQYQVVKSPAGDVLPGPLETYADNPPSLLRAEVAGVV